jgi:hypothetical protein
MSWPLNYCIPIGETGIDDLRAQFMVVDTGVLVNSGAAIDTGFYEDGGYYYWEYANHDDSFFGLVKFYRASAPATTLGMAAINPREAENLDAKVSTGVTLSAPVLLAIADALNARSVSHVEDTAEEGSHAELILMLLKGVTVDDLLTIYKTDGVTPFNTRTLTLDPDALPITGVA